MFPLRTARVAGTGVAKGATPLAPLSNVMADFSALSVVAQTVAALLNEACPRDEFTNPDFPVINAGTLNNVAGSLPPTVPALGVTLFPYRVAYNAQHRPVRPRVASTGERFRASLLLDLHFLLTAWANNAAEQLRLLAWAARTLEDTPSLPARFLNRWAPAREAVFGLEESVDLAHEPLSAQDLVSIWEVNKPRQQPSLGYVARMIVVDSHVRVPDAGIVRTRVLDHGALVP